MQEALKRALNEQEFLKLQVFIEDEVMMNAVKKVLLFGVYNNGHLKGYDIDPTRNFALQLAARGDMSNEQLGADLRAKSEGIFVVENAFNQMLTAKEKKEEEKKKENPAR